MAEAIPVPNACLVMGSKNYSSWSLRPWLFMRKTGFAFTEQVIHFDLPDYQQRIAAVSPSRRVPLLIIGENTVWDSLAICEFAAGVTGRGLPADPTVRARVRSAAAEMHAGFQTLRDACPMNVRARGRQVPRMPLLLADIARIDALWNDCRSRFGSGGEWLCGEFSLADAMFAPVLFRFRTYGADLSSASRAYLDHAIADPELRAWDQAAQLEGHPLPAVDAVGR